MALTEQVEQLGEKRSIVHSTSCEMVNRGLSLGPPGSRSRDGMTCARDLLGKHHEEGGTGAGRLGERPSEMEEGKKM